MARKSKYTRAFLEPIIKESYSFHDVVRLLELSESAGNRQRIAYLVKKYALDTSHFLRNGNRKNVKPKRDFNNDDILFSEHSYRSGSSNDKIIKRLVELGKPYVCDDCGICNQWNNKPLRLQLEHTDGNRYNNNKDNLRFLCPNCHSQTPTFGGKNIKKLAA